MSLHFSNKEKEKNSHSKISHAYDVWQLIKYTNK